jgi:hypothetical protein
MMPRSTVRTRAPAPAPQATLLAATPPPPSLRDLVYGVFASSTLFLGQLAHGVDSFRGSDANPQPLGDQADCPWAYVDLMDEVADGLNPYLLNGVIRLWVYDYPPRGFAKIIRALSYAQQVLADYIATVDAGPDVAYFADDGTGACILNLTETAAISGPAEDVTLGRLQRWASWPYGKAYQGVAA